MSVPFFCRRCSEMLTAQDEDCPFCGDAATPIDELVDQASRELSCMGYHDLACAVANLQDRLMRPSLMPNVRSAEV